MKIVSYNLNGIRAALKKGLLDWIDEVQPDIFCVQESKANQDQIDSTPFEERGYHIYWNGAEKKGYSGVVVFTKTEAKTVSFGMGIEKYDIEGRIIKVDFDGWSLINSYFPSGSSGEIRHNYKMDYLADFKLWVDQIKMTHENLVVLGDYNIVHTDLDIHNPKKTDHRSGCQPEEKAWLTEWFDSGFVDAYRDKHPEEKTYSWWTYRMGARGKDKGWRIDYTAVSNTISDKIVDAYQDKNAVHSDHCPVILEIEL